MSSGWRSVADVIGGSAGLARGIVPWRRATPRRLARIGRAISDHGLTLSGLTRVAAIRHGDDVVMVDDAGPVTAGQLDRWASTVAGELLHRGLVVSGGRLGVLCRNGRWFAVAVMAAQRLGADVVVIPPDLATGALAELLRMEQLRTVVHDEELADALAGARYRGVSVLCDTSAPGVPSLRSMQALPQAPVPTPTRRGSLVLTTVDDDGQPRRTRRRGAGATAGVPLTTLVRRLDATRGTAMLITAPLAQPLGLQFLALAIGLGCPAVVSNRLDAARCWRLIEEHRVATVVAHPSLLAELVKGVGDRTVPASLRAIITGGGPLSVADWQAAVDVLGPVVHHVYGGGEVGWCTLATPHDLAVAPGTVGRAAAGIDLQVVDDAGRPVPPGTVGRLLVRSPLAAVDAATDAGGWIDSGDLGRLDAEGRLFVEPPAADRAVVGGWDGLGEPRVSPP